MQPTKITIPKKGLNFSKVLHAAARRVGALMPATPKKIENFKKNAENTLWKQ